MDVSITSNIFNKIVTGMSTTFLITITGAGIALIVISQFLVSFFKELKVIKNPSAWDQLPNGGDTETKTRERLLESLVAE